MNSIDSHAASLSKRKNILLLFFGRANNLGDLAILKGHVKFLKKIFPDIEITLAHSVFEQLNIPGILLRKHPFKPSSQASTLVIAFSSFVAMLSHLLRRLFYDFVNAFHKELDNPYNRYDLIIDAHAGTIKGGEHMLLEGIYNAISMFFTTLIFKAPVIAGPTSAMGPFRSKMYKFILRSIYSRVEMIFIRENISKNYLRDIGIPEHKICFLFDMGFWLDPCSPKRVEEILELENLSPDKPLVAIIPNTAIHTCGFSKIKGKKEKYEAYIQGMVGLIHYIRQEIQCTVLLVPFQRYGGMADEKVCQDIVELVGDRESVIYLERSYAPEEIKDLLGYCDVVVSCRLHPGIFAISMRTPVIMIAGDRQRANGIIGEIGQQDECIICIQDIKDSQEFLSVLEEKVTYVWHHRDILKDKLNRRLPDGPAGSINTYSKIIQGILEDSNFHT